MAAVTKSNDGNKTMADEELPEESGEARDLPERQGGGQPPSGPPAPKRAAPAGDGFFTIYKKGQGYWTRMGTAIGAGFLGLMFAFELYNQIPTFLHGTQQRDKKIAGIVAALFMIGFSAWAFWFTNKPSTVDFLVATDSEMKKVNWTTRKELIGSTRIVILFMFLIALYLFLCDLLFGGFFNLIHVLRTWF